MKLQTLIQNELQAQSQASQAATKLLVAFVEKLELILQTQASGDSQDQENSELVSAAASIGSQSQNQLIIDNQAVYKTM